MINVGIVGCGYVGAAMKSWLEENNKEANVLVSDPAKGYNDDLSEVDIAFVQINVPTEDDGTQDLTLMKNLIHKLPKVPVFVRTTILPGTSEKLSKDTGHDVYFMPEFLSERTHIEDFKEQTMVFTGALELLTKVFPGKKFIVMSPLEAELAKYIHNVFGAYKVTYFNAAKEYVEKSGGEWANVHKGVLLSGYINDTHTYVPGPDGKLGYGGKCFPKDVNAFAKMTQGTSMGTLLSPLQELNVHFRGNEKQI
jgi:UDPglucose 6-dehydrogenase